jgi:hypothetical protein
MSTPVGNIHAIRRAACLCSGAAQGQDRGSGEPAHSTRFADYLNMREFRFLLV